MKRNKQQRVYLAEVHCAVLTARSVDAALTGLAVLQVPRGRLRGRQQPWQQGLGGRREKTNKWLGKICYKSL